MTKEQVFNILQKAISHISENFCAEHREQYLDIQLKEKNLPFEYSIDDGVSKAVILIKGAPFVIKIPFYQLSDESAYEDNYYEWSKARDEALDNYCLKRQQETQNSSYSLTKEEIDMVTQEFKASWGDEPTLDDSIYFEDLCGASCINLDGEEDDIPDWNYCELETAIYRKAAAEGLARYFAEEECLGFIDNTPIYWQARCTPLSEITMDYHSEEYKRKKKTSEKLCDKLDTDCFNAIWIADFIDFYGESEFERLVKFLDKYEIDDLRPCNIGYIDKAPILFDFSGYRGW